MCWGVTGTLGPKKKRGRIDKTQQSEMAKGERPFGKVEKRGLHQDL